MGSGKLRERERGVHMLNRVKRNLRSRFARSGAMGKQRSTKQILDGANNLVTQVNSLLVSTANPSDDTSLSIRLSMVKVSFFMWTVSSVFLNFWARAALSIEILPDI